MDLLLKEFMFLGKISVTDSEVIAFYMRAESLCVAGRVEGVPPSNRGQDARDTIKILDTKMGATEVL